MSVCDLSEDAHCAHSPTQVSVLHGPPLPVELTLAQQALEFQVRAWSQPQGNISKLNSPSDMINAAKSRNLGRWAKRGKIEVKEQD